MKQMLIILKMFKFLKIIYFSFFISFFTSLVHAKPNQSIIDEALGFMIGGDGGWQSFSIDYQVEDCVVTYTQDFMGSTLVATYDFNKAYWNSASSEIGEDGTEYFILNGEIGVQEVYLYSEEGEDLSDGLFMFGLSPGPSNMIFFPIIVEINRFEKAMVDLMYERKGLESKY